MKRVFAFILSIIILVSSSMSFAAPGDFIHTGLKKGYSVQNADDRAALIRDLKDSSINKDLFYREIEGGKYINIVEEEKEQEKKFKELLASKGVNTSDPYAIEAFIQDPKNIGTIQAIGGELEKVTTEFAKLFDGITDENKGYIEEYFKNLYAQRLQTPGNYSIPVAGSKDNTTRIVNLTLPSSSGASRWMVKVGDTAFGPFDINSVILDGKPYNSGTDIEVSIGKYLLLAAVDSSSRIKAYASIELTAEMVKAPRVPAEKDETITSGLVLAPSEKLSGATTVSGLTGSWKLAVLDTMPITVYESDKFNSVDFVDGIELIVANDEELDNMSETFKKYIIVYSEIDGKIEKYNIVEVISSQVSEAFYADELVLKDGIVTTYNYSLPMKGNNAGTTKIEELLGLETFNATKWMYKVGTSLTVPLLDRVVEGSVDYVAGEDIIAGIGQDLMILATDNSGRVKAYGIVKEISEGMIKNPLAEELRETTHYTKPVKGTAEGTTQFGFLKYTGVISWKYVTSDEVIPAPELNSSLGTGTDINLVNDVSDNIMVESDSAKLKADNGFRKYMMVYGLDGSNNVKVYKSFIMNDSNVKIPNANPLVVGTNYSQPIKGNAPNTTRIETLKHTGLTSTSFRYKVIDTPLDIEFNQKVDGLRDLRANVDVPTTINKHLLILAVDSSNRTKGYAIQELTFDNVKAGNAPMLQSITNYQGPVPGSDNKSTKFTFLNLPAGASKWVYKVGSTSFGIPETGAIVTNDTDYKPYTPYEDITGVSSEQYLLLVAVSSDDKVIAYREFRLNDNEVKGSTAPILVSNAYTLMKGDKPSTTKLKLEPLGLEYPLSISWRYKLVDSEPSNDIEKPYLNQIITDSVQYSVNYTTKIGSDITVTKTDESYGYILVLATDFTGRTKAYKYIPVISDNVKEHAPEISGADISEGSIIDSVKIINLPASTGEKYKYLIGNTEPATPAAGDTLPSGAVDYTGDDIVLQIGRYLTLYDVDASNKIVAYKTFKVNAVKQGTAALSSDTLLEGSIKNGGSSFTIQLGLGATWADVVNTKSIRDKLFNGLKASSEAAEWSKVVSSLIVDGKGSISLSGDTVTILLPQTLSYDIKDEQKISLIIPPEAIVGAINPITASGTLTIKPTIGATISGDVVNSVVRQSDIKAGGKTIVVDLTDGIWSTDVSGIIDYFNAIGTGTNWSEIANAVRTKGSIVRNSGTRVTITLPAVSSVDFGTTSEIISLTIPITSNLIQGATEDVIASPNFTVYPDILKIEGIAVEENNKVNLMAPDYRIVDINKDTWIIEVITGSLKDTITNNDVVITGLPKGLVTNASKVDSNSIEIKVSGTASTTLTTNPTKVSVKVKGIAVTQPNSQDSNDIWFELVKGDSLIAELEKVEVNVLGKKLKDDTLDLNSDKIEFSLNSTNGSDGDWFVATIANTSNIEFKPGKVYVREKANPKVFYLVTTLSNPKAPISISVSEVDYSSSLKVKLSGFETGIDYDISTDGGNNWDDSFDGANSIELTSSTDLRVRYRATENSLPSLATAKLNGLDLRSVKMDVGAGKIIGTTTVMEYSLNDGETYAAARANETPVIFVNGAKVVIREKARPMNKYTIGTVGIVASPTVDSVSFNVLGGTITDTLARGLQYRIGTDGWKDLSSTVTENKNIQFKQGVLEVRAKGTLTELPSEPTKLGIIDTPTSAPELRIDDFNKNISYWDGSSWIELEDVVLKDILEYKINDGPWKDNTDWAGDKLTDSIKNSNTKISIRFKATTIKLPSLIKIVNFTGNLTFENVKLNVVEGKIDGTTTAMQYSINSTDGLNGTWIDARAGSTTVEFIQGMKVYIREKSKPLNWNELSSGIVVETAITTGDFNYSIVNGTITNKALRILEYRIGTDPWKLIDRANSVSEPYIYYGAVFKPGSLQIRARGTDKTLPSSAITVNTKERASAPSLKYDDVKYTIESIGIPEGIDYEYNINGGPWTSGDVNTQFEGGNVVLVRLKATDDTLPSLEQKITFSNNLYLGNVVLNAGKSQLENTTTLMEYSMDSTNGEDGLWYQCTATTTKIDLKPGTTVYVREKAKPRNSQKLRDGMAAISKKTFTDAINVVNNNLDYDILRKTISINNVSSGNLATLQGIVDNLQYRIGTGNWINVDYVTLSVGESKVLAFNVNFIPGNLEFRLRGDIDNLPSDSFIKTVIKAPASVPDASVGFDLANYKNIIDGTTANLEYSFGLNGPWIDGVHLNTEDLVGSVYIRTKATKDTLPSLIKTLVFTPVINLKTIVLSTHVTPFELNGTTTQMQYQIYLNNGNQTGWKDCTPDSYGNTKLPDWLVNMSNVTKIEIRDKNQIKNVVEINIVP